MAQRVQEDDQSAELRRLRAELKQGTEEPDILKMAAAYCVFFNTRSYFAQNKSQYSLK